MSFNPASPTKYRGTDQYLVPVVVRSYTPGLPDYRQPETGRNYPIGCVWQVGKDPTDGDEGDLYMLSKIVANEGYWIQVSEGSVGPLIGLTADIEDTTYIAGDIPSTSFTVNPVSSLIRIAGDNGINTVEAPNIPGALVVRFSRGNVQTIGAVTANCLTQPIIVKSAKTIQIVVSGYSQDGFAVGAYGTAIVKNVSGTASLVNTTGLLVSKDSALSAVNITVTTSGSNLLVNVLGQATKTINWQACLPGISLTEPFP